MRLQIGAFIIWLVDCFACTPLTRAKLTVGKPLAFLLELVRSDRLVPVVSMAQS
jgi:hypothetical protein